MVTFEALLEEDLNDDRTSSRWRPSRPQLPITGGSGQRAGVRRRLAPLLRLELPLPPLPPSFLAAASADSRSTKCTGEEEEEERSQRRRRARVASPCARGRWREEGLRGGGHAQVGGPRPRRSGAGGGGGCRRWRCDTRVQGQGPGCRRLGRG
jgi:hypothetical protein